MGCKFGTSLRLSCTVLELTLGNVTHTDLVLNHLTGRVGMPGESTKVLLRGGPRRDQSWTSTCWVSGSINEGDNPLSDMAGPGCAM